MAIKPKVQTLTNSSVDIMNAIRNGASVDYRHYVPVATDDAESLKTIGTVIMDNPQLQNEFVSALVNRIGRVILTSKMYSNPWAMFKKGLLEFGETVEEIFVNIAKPFTYDPSVAEKEVFKRELPDIKSAFHIMNYQKFYKSTVQQFDLRKAFLAWSGITDLIAKIIDAMVTGANYDEYQTMKYMLARNILNGRLLPVTVGATTPNNVRNVVSNIKATSNNMEFLSSKFNMAGVQTKADKKEQYVILDSSFDASIDVEVLATAFNMDKAEFMGHRVLVDGFGSLDNARLRELFSDDPTYVEVTEAEQILLNQIPAVMVTEDFFMIFDNLYNFTEQFNGEGLYWNHWYHVWKTFSVSPFANAALFVQNEPSVESVTLTPNTATITVGGTLALAVGVATNNFASKGVVFTSSSENVEVSASGVVKVLPTAETDTDVTITATSTFDSTKSATCTLTIV